MSIENLMPKSRAILEYVKAHPWATSVEVADALTATHTYGDVASMLWTLWTGRYIARRVSPTRKSEKGMRVFEYVFRTENPRRRHPRVGKRSKRHGIVVRKPRDTNVGYLVGPGQVVADKTKVEQRVHPEMAAPGMHVEVLIAVKGVHETLVLTLPQAKDLRKQLETLGD